MNSRFFNSKESKNFMDYKNVIRNRLTFHKGTLIRGDNIKKNIFQPTIHRLRDDFLNHITEANMKKLRDEFQILNLTDKGIESLIN